MIDQHPTTESKSNAHQIVEHKAERVGTWNVRSLHGLEKMKQLSGEMKRYRLAVLAVTETHLPGEGLGRLC